MFLKHKGRWCVKVSFKNGQSSLFCNFDNRWMFASDVIPHRCSHSLSKEEYIPDKIVSEHRLVRPIGILGRVWCLIVSIPDLCNLTYFGTYSANYFKSDILVDIAEHK